MNFKEWQDTSIVEYSCEMGRDGIRDIYKLPNNIILYDETYLPRSIFKPQYHQTLIDFIIHKSKEYIIKNAGGSLDYERYTDAGFGYPVFVGADSTEKAFNFAMNIKNI
jgi:hypothetical protein